MHTRGTAAAAIVAGLLVGCGGSVEQAAGGGGSAGVGGAQSGGGSGGSAAQSPCWDDLSFPCGGPQTVLPGAGGDGGFSAVPCTISLEMEIENPNEVNVAVDCELVPYCEIDCGLGDESWRYDDFAGPTAVILSGALCSRLGETGFTVIDIVRGCGGPPLF
jgi:hypothetical protein